MPGNFFNNNNKELDQNNKEIAVIVGSVDYCIHDVDNDD